MKITDAIKQAWKAGKSAYNEKGEEIPDPTPLEAPIDFRAPLPLHEELRRLFSSQQQADMRDAGVETFEEADNFDVDDDEDMSSPWEEGFEAGVVWRKEAEVRAGVVAPPDPKAKELIEKLNRLKAEKAAAAAKPSANHAEGKA